MSVVPGESRLSDSQRAAWSKGDRAERYREQASRFQQMAKMEAEPRARERLLGLANQYLELANRVEGQNTRTPAEPSPTTRDRNG